MWVKSLPPYHVTAVAAVAAVAAAAAAAAAGLSSKVSKLRRSQLQKESHSVVLNPAILFYSPSFRETICRRRFNENFSLDSARSFSQTSRDAFSKAAGLDGLRTFQLWRESPEKVISEERRKKNQSVALAATLF